MDETRLYLLALHFVPGVGNQLIRQLISYCGSAEQVFKARHAQLLRIPGIGEVTARSIKSAVPIQTAEDEVRLADKAGASLLFYLDDQYPSRLKDIGDAPTLLYARGNASLNDDRVVAIVGTRHATDYGKFCVEEIVAGLVPYGVTIVSGLAYGIDIHAHKMALSHGLRTHAVLGSGADVVYPHAHRDTAIRMLSAGALISESPMGTKPEAHLFPARNRIIAGLADAVIVVEAAAKGGALITAEIANTYNRDVFAVPGGLGQRLSEGCNDLIKTNKAHLFTSVADLEYITQWLPGKKQDRTNASDLSSFSGHEYDVLKTLLDAKEPVPIDTLSWRTGVSLNQLAGVLLTLEFKGKVQALPGKCFKFVSN